MTISSIHICTKSPDPAKLLLYKKMLGKTQTALHAQSPYTRGSKCCAVWPWPYYPKPNTMRFRLPPKSNGFFLGPPATFPPNFVNIGFAQSC